MKNKVVRIVIFLACLFIPIGISYNIYKDINYFLSKKEANAAVLNISNQGYHKPFKVKLRYLNQFINKWDTTNIELETIYIEKLKHSDLNHIKISYAKNFPDEVYLEFKEPKLAILFFSCYWLSSCA